MWRPLSTVQVDGPIEEENMKYTFKSEYAEEDLSYTIEEIFPEKNANIKAMVQIICALF